MKGKSQRLPGTDDGALALSAHECCVHQGCKGLVGHLCAMSHILGREQTGHKDPEAAAVGNRSSRAVDVAVGSGSPAVTVGSFSCPSKTLFWLWRSLVEHSNSYTSQHKHRGQALGPPGHQAMLLMRGYPPSILCLIKDELLPASSISAGAKHCYSKSEETLVLLSEKL